MPDCGHQLVRHIVHLMQSINTYKTVENWARGMAQHDSSLVT